MNRSNLALSAVVAVIGMAPVAMAGEPQPWAFSFQPGASPTMERITSLASFINVVIVAITLLVSGLLLYACTRFRADRNPKPATWSHNTPLEVVWTAIPAVILLLIAIPSFRLLYFMDRVQDAEMTLKIVGHQWYWTYEYPDHDFKFDSNMVQAEDLKPGQPRLLTADNTLVVPAGVPIRLQMTADDVIHSWSVPAFGIKTDAVPGRLNETWVQVKEPGTYYGQCSQLCGVNHGFMPVHVKAVPKEEFLAWVAQAKKTFAHLDGTRPETTVALAETAGGNRP
ncbi:Cytochrome c oxidase polypeptide II [Paramagnetospirillum magnetotacticum MS-1]|uniref:Cytochrome c oxidase subunit 2 n=1 Tax=Paramagnetospirillum magnetotacticum MS-1 TaxID=272627 RepID=A0A0C2UA20_PARME|nr:cytochrome c oxidase subunit II [Paramagnetospirillum magnetotacticum]KIL98332.1 Cytochrome c oxidase polypeptide II [Paramagnetospirillum magnetotacticum MS-1]